MAGQDALGARPRLLRPVEVARLLDIGRTTVHDWTVAGRLEAVIHPSTGWRRYPEDQPALHHARELREALAAREAAQ